MKRIPIIFFLAALTGVAGQASGGVIQLPRTGQALSLAAGDDAALLQGAAWPGTRFAVQADSSVTDSLTGLVWAGNGSTPAVGACAAGARDWAGALAYVSCLNSNAWLGQNDWRLPTVTEMLTLPNAAQANSAAWLNSQGFTGAQSGYYWTSTSDGATPAGFAWTVQVSTGATFSDDKSLAYQVWPVRRGPVGDPLPSYPANNRRSGQTISQAAADDGALLRGVTPPQTRFTLATGTAVVTDNLTRLVWAKNAGTPAVGACSGGPKNWQGALDYVACLNNINYQGRSSWRLPNRAELESLVDYSASAPALAASAPFSSVLGSYWSSTSDAADPANSSWYLSPLDGSLSSTGKLAAVDVWPVSGPDSTVPAPSLKVALPKTGQSVAAAPLDDGTLQSGYPWPSSRFADNGQTMIDTLTGLEWTKIADAPDPGACRPAVNGADMTWQEALDYVKCLNTANFLGRSDWRLPTVNELESLADAGAADGTAALAAKGFTSVKTDFWTATTDPAGLIDPGDSAWGMKMTNGEIVSSTKDSLLGAWPVRSSAAAPAARVWQSGQSLCYNAAGATVSCAGTGQNGDSLAGVVWPEPRLAANVGQTMTDNLTGLIWARDASVPTVGGCAGTTKDWAGALAYVACLNSANYLGHNDWRLPNRKELRSLIDYGMTGPALPSGNGLTGVSGYYWSSTTKADDPARAWALNLTFADQVEFAKTSAFALLPVRGGQRIAAGRGFLDFGAPELNGAAVELPLTVANRGMFNLALGSVNVSGTGSALFSIAANTCTAALLPGQTCVVTARFTPNAEGFKDAALTIASSDPDTPALSTPLGALVPDRRPPVVNLASPVSGSTNIADQRLQFTATGGNVLVKIDGAVVNKHSGEMMTPLTDGSHIVRVEAADASGNVGVAEANIVFVRPSGKLTTGGDTLTLGDALMALKIAIGLVPFPTDTTRLSGDVAPLVNGKPQPDGEITIGDAIVILRKAVGAISF